MTEKRRLGRGLGALIPDTTDSGASLREIDITRIKTNPFQPRGQFDQEKLHELADSIREHGVVQPVIVSPGKDGYTLVAGERRLRAAQLAGLNTIPALTREMESGTMLQIALIENLQREDLNPIEEARAYRQLMEEFNYTQEELAQKLGKSRPAIANTTRLLSLPNELQQEIISGKISEGQARPLLAVPDPALQDELAKKIIREKLTVREVERLIAKGRDNLQPRKRAKPPRADIIAGDIWEEMRERLQYYLGTRVKITHGSRGGAIEIEFYETEDLERLIDLIMPEE